MIMRHTWTMCIRRIRANRPYPQENTGQHPPYLLVAVNLTITCLHILQFTAINDGDIFSIKAFLVAKKILVLNITLKCIQEHQSGFCDVITSPLIGKLETVGTALSINNYSSDIAEGYAICYREQRSIRIKFTRANATYCISGAVVLKQMD